MKGAEAECLACAAYVPLISLMEKKIGRRWVVVMESYSFLLERRPEGHQLKSREWVMRICQTSPNRGKTKGFGKVVHIHYLIETTMS